MNGRGDGRLCDRVAIITGAGSGLGRASARLFASEGASVVVADVDEQRGAATVALIEEDGGTAYAHTCDVSDERQVSDLVQQALHTFGTVDIMFNNAAVVFQGPFEDHSVQEMRRLLDVNVMGPFLGAKHVIPVMKRRRRGVILNSSSAGSLASVPHSALYASSKGALNVLTRDLAVELGAHNIRVNALCSMGGMSANFVLPAGAPVVDEDELYRDWTPDDSIFVLKGPRSPRLLDHANAALFLASDEAYWISGVCLPIDGATIQKAAVDVRRSAYGALATDPPLVES